MARILLAEDDEDMRRFLVKALEKAGHDVESFSEGLSAFEELKSQSFDLLLTDIVMPEMDGIELARRAAELDPGLKIMFITGFRSGGAASGLARPEGSQGAVQTVPPQRSRGGS